MAAAAARLQWHVGNGEEMSSYSVPRGKGCGEAGRDEGRRRSRGEPSEGNARARGRWGGGAAEQSLGAEQLPSGGMRRRWKRKRRPCYVRGCFGWDARWGSGRRGARSGSRRGLGEPCEPAVAPVRHSRNSSVPPRRWTGRAPHRTESGSESLPTLQTAARIQAAALLGQRVVGPPYGQRRRQPPPPRDLCAAQEEAESVVG